MTLLHEQSANVISLVLDRAILSDDCWSGQLLRDQRLGGGDDRANHPERDQVRTMKVLDA